MNWLNCFGKWLWDVFPGPVMAAAEAAPDDSVSGKVVIGIIGAITTGVATILAHKHGEKRGAEARNVTIQRPVPTVKTREEPAWATKPELVTHVEHTEKRFCEVWDAIQAERGVSREALGRIHARMDEQSTATANLKGKVDEVSANVCRLLNLALNRKAEDS